MSILDHLASVRLYWDGRRGAAVGPASRCALDAKPDLGFRYVEVDYSPGVCCQVRREAWHQPDDMRPEELDACARFLRDLRRVPGVVAVQPIDTATGQVCSGPVYQESK